ncbi:MAG: ATP synthase gamma chain [Candidatus Amesbacteria bacterium GW2011_GWA2_47_11b]|uniref:ATP synthase gamma chain n=1 Tax=Candidatus Amesbacteria bacterium GW2011_GWA2_47_11b TaxID=1618358 RepID=A0A0G1UFP7_9BACT|nr:MAG: ATP synthase gamma chain [Candidatus Amesbacteria bacterium GW2011_GWA2_47_11b]
MASKRQIDSERLGLLEIKSLVDAYEEIAAGRMQKVRSAVLTAREFLGGLSEVFGEVKFNYTKEVLTVERKKRLGKTVAVWISANAGLYGDIVERSFQLFADYLAKNQAEAVVVGRLGTKMMADRLPKMLYNYYDLEDDRVEVEDLVLVMRYLLQYQKIVVFYGQFKSLVNQVPTATAVSGDELYELKPEEQKKHQYLFEPKIEEVLEFFEGQMLTTMFEQTVHESQLAKFASRLMALDTAVENIDRKVTQLNQAGVRLKHRQDSRKQLNRIAGISLWQ